MTSNKLEVSYINSLKRSGAAMIDVFIVTFFRIILLQILGHFWIEEKMLKFASDFKAKFGNEAVLSDSNLDHIKFLASHELVKVVFICLVLVLLVGALYHAYLNSSSWSATVGKRLFKIVLVKDEGKALTFWQAFSHYFLSLVPWFFAFYIFIYSLKAKVSIIVAMVHSPANIIIGFITAIWLQFHIFNKRKRTIQDVVVGCSMVEGRLGGTWPKKSFK